MAYAPKGDPLKKQKDSLNFKNRAVDRLAKKAWGTAKEILLPGYAIGKRMAEKYKQNPQSIGTPLVGPFNKLVEKVKKRKADKTAERLGRQAGAELVQQTGLRATLTHKPKPRKPVKQVGSSITPRGVQLTPTPAPKADKMPTPFTNRLNPQRPSNGKHPRKVKTREKVTRRGRTKTTKTKY